MKRVHNVRVRVHNTDRTVVDGVLARADTFARHDPEETFTRSVVMEDGLAIGELWLDRQQPVRRFMRAFVAAMGEGDRGRVREDPSRFLDTGTHCFFLLDRAAFIEGRVVLTRDPTGSVNVRLNIACWPANKENAARVLTGLVTDTGEGPAD
jgi:RNA binding exosome subunit